MAPSSDKFIITTRGEALVIAQQAHTTVCTLFIQHRASIRDGSGYVGSSVAMAGLIPQDSASGTNPSSRTGGIRRREQQGLAT